MRFLLAMSVLLAVNANAADTPDHDFAEAYFAAWVATQQPNATVEDLEKYLGFLADDVGYEHKPYRLMDADTSDGKEHLREGMTYYLGKNERYDAQLSSVVRGPGVVAIEYSGIHVFRRGGEGPVLTESFTSVDVLEVAKSRVTSIRHFR